MKPTFFVSVVALGTVLVVAPVVALAATVDLGRGGFVLTAAGIQLSGTAVMSRAVLLAAVPRRDPGHGRRWRRRGPLVAIAVGVLVGLVGLWLSLGPLSALGLAAGWAVVLTLLVRVLDRWAAATARDTPIDVPRGNDDLVLDPLALRLRLQRVVMIGVFAGSLLGGGVAAVAILVGGRPGDAAGGGLSLFALTVAVVLTGGTFGPLMASARRVNAVAHGWSGKAWRVSCAILLGRADRLRESDRELAPHWAQAALPNLVVQMVFQTGVMTMVLMAQVVPFVMEPTVGPRLWLVLGLTALLLLAAALVGWQYVTTRRFAGRHPVAPDPTT